MSQTKNANQEPQPRDNTPSSPPVNTPSVICTTCKYVANTYKRTKHCTPSRTYRATRCTLSQRKVNPLQTGCPLYTFYDHLPPSA